MPEPAIEPLFVSATNAYRVDETTLDLALRIGDTWHRYRLTDALALATADQLTIVAEAEDV